MKISCWKRLLPTGNQRTFNKKSVRLFEDKTNGFKRNNTFLQTINYSPDSDTQLFL